MCTRQPRIYYLLEYGPFGLQNSSKKHPRQHTRAYYFSDKISAAKRLRRCTQARKHHRYCTGIRCPQRRYTHVFHGVRARLGCTTASVLALAHAHVHQIAICLYEVGAANVRHCCLEVNTSPVICALSRWCIYHYHCSYSSFGLMHILFTATGWLVSL